MPRDYSRALLELRAEEKASATVAADSRLPAYFAPFRWLSGSCAASMPLAQAEASGCPAKARVRWLPVANRGEIRHGVA